MGREGVNVLAVLPKMEMSVLNGNVSFFLLFSFSILGKTFHPTPPSRKCERVAKRPNLTQNVLLLLAFLHKGFFFSAKDQK